MSAKSPFAASASGDSLRLCANFSADEQRQRLPAAFALRNEIFAAAFASEEQAVCQTKLAWWQDELTRIQNAQARHPLAQRLQTMIAGENDAGELMQEWLVAANALFERDQPDNVLQYRIAAYRTYGAALRLALDPANNHTTLCSDLAVGLSLLDEQQFANTQDTADLRRELFNEVYARITEATIHCPHVALAVLANLLTRLLAKPEDQTPSLSPLRLLFIAWRGARRSRRLTP